MMARDKIERKNALKRVDVYLAGKYPEYSRAFFQKLIRAGYVKADGKTIKPCRRLKESEILEIVFPEAAGTGIRKRKIKGRLDVVHEDEAIIVINFFGLIVKIFCILPFFRLGQPAIFCHFKAGNVRGM